MSGRIKPPNLCDSFDEGQCEKAQNARLGVRCQADVRNGSFCDIGASLAEVRFAPYIGRITRRRRTG